MTTKQIPRRHSRQMSSRAQLGTIGLIALLAWGGLLLFTRYVPPQSVAALLLVFVLLALALFCTFTPLLYLLAYLALRARLLRPNLVHARRRSLLLTTFIIFNLLLRVLQSWSVSTAVMSLGIIVVIELLVLGGK